MPLFFICVSRTPSVRTFCSLPPPSSLPISPLRCSTAASTQGNPLNAIPESLSNLGNLRGTLVVTVVDDDGTTRRVRKALTPARRLKVDRRQRCCVVFSAVPLAYPLPCSFGCVDVRVQAAIQAVKMSLAVNDEAARHTRLAQEEAATRESALKVSALSIVARCGGAGSLCRLVAAHSCV